MMRIITGEARGTKLVTLEGENTRPTAERVKEALFSMLQFDLEGRSVLDLFSGSGQLGLEAISRGAARATMIDVSREATAVMMENAKKTRLFDRCRISCADYASFIRGAAGRETYDIVFLDPPYASGLVAEALRRLSEAKIFSPGALIACETDTGSDARPSRRRISKEEAEAAEKAAILSEVFGGDAALANRFCVQRSVSYGRSRITILCEVDA